MVICASEGGNSVWLLAVCLHCYYLSSWSGHLVAVHLVIVLLCYVTDSVALPFRSTKPHEAPATKTEAGFALLSLWVVSFLKFISAHWIIHSFFSVSSLFTHSIEFVVFSDFTILKFYSVWFFWHLFFCVIGTRNTGAIYTERQNQMPLRHRYRWLWVFITCVRLIKCMWCIPTVVTSQCILNTAGTSLIGCWWRK